MSSLDTCTVCARRVAGDGPGVGVSASGNPVYVPFVDDLRTSALTLRHVPCFIEERSLDSFLGVLREHDEWVRRSLSECHSRLGE